jgi:predicted TIM-barrel fold metal-dependent hydrolase
MLALALVLAAVAGAPPSLAPAVDHHQHLASPAMVALVGRDGGVKPLDATGLARLLDAAGIRRAVVLSVAYMYGKPGRRVEDEYAKVRAENDWTGAQAARLPGRLRAFCGVNPLKEYALAELERCAKDPNLRTGIKLHFGNSDVQLDVPEHLDKLRRVFRAANEHRMAIVVHLRASISRERPYGAEQARLFVEELLPLAPDVVVQVAHLAGTGPGFDDPPAHAALEFLANAVERGDARARRLWFDVTTVAAGQPSPAISELLVGRIRQIGVERVVYGSDLAAGGNLAPREGWAAFRRLPLRPDELEAIAKNVAPYLR